MSFRAQAKYIWYSPYKMRVLADSIRGKNVLYALRWLEIYGVKRRSEPLAKVVASAAANAKNLQNVEPENLVITKLYVDEGPRRKYFKPAAMGRSQILRTRSCHITVELEDLKTAQHNKNKNKR